jgi:hypothetical protein
LEGIIWSEISQAQEGKYYMISLMCNLKKLTSKNFRVEWWFPGAGALLGGGGEGL